MRFYHTLLCMLICFSARGTVFADEAVKAAQRLGQERTFVSIQPDGLYICESEEFQPESNSQWTAQRLGQNYYAATFANSFLSRKAFLGAPEQCDESIASLNVKIEEAGNYLALVRYEAAYRFETQFRVQIEQDGKKVFDRRYGARDNMKIWAFREKLKKEVGWSWGAVENIVWEGHDTSVKLKPGIATIRLIASEQPEPAAKRNIDLVMLTTDREQVRERIEKENYLPLDGMLTQSGDVWLRVANRGKEPLTFQGVGEPGGGNWREHSPYWVHMRQWKVPTIMVEPGKTSEWVEVGGTMDSLYDGQWSWTGNGPYKAEFGIRGADSKIRPFAEFTGNGKLALAADADTRYSKRLRRQEEVLYELLADLKKANPAPHGRVPTKTIIYASTFTPMDQGKHAAAVNEFKKLFGLTDPSPDAPAGRGYIDVRSVATPKLDEFCKNLGTKAKGIATVSLGDEINLPAPPKAMADEGFRSWLIKQKIKPSDVDPKAGNDWNKITYTIDPSLKDTKPGDFYWSKRYQYHFGIQGIKTRTDILRKHLPHAGIGANFSPHYPQEHMFLGEVYKWVNVFREEGMTLPWSEDYIWQVAVGSPQMNNINLDLFRAGLRHHPNRSIHYYIMPHMPNNTPSQWKRLFYGALGHGMKTVNLFEFRPVHVAYTENHVDDPAMYRMILGSFRELGLFEDIIQSGTVRPAKAALWFSETGDIWGDNHGSFAAAKRGLYTAIRHQQIPLDVVVEEDATDNTLNQYQVLYLTDAHVSAAASKKLATWVRNGGRLFATAGGGMFDELNRPNTTLRELLGVNQTQLHEPDGSQIIWIKQDLPFAKPIATVKLETDVPVYCVKSQITPTEADVISTFTDGSPAITTHPVGKGSAHYCAFLPALSYYHPAIPRRPIDRGATDDAMVHFLPTEFEPSMATLIATPAKGLPLPVDSNVPLVESTVIESPQGIVIPLVNWSGKAVTNLQLTITLTLPTDKVTLASGKPVNIIRDGETTRLKMELDIADAIIIRK